MKRLLFSLVFALLLPCPARPQVGGNTPFSIPIPVPVIQGGTGVKTATGTGSVVLSDSPAIMTPTIAQINAPSTTLTLQPSGTTGGMTIASSGSTNMVTLYAGGIGNGFAFRFQSDIFPDSDDNYYLGTSGNRFIEIHGTTYFAGANVQGATCPTGAPSASFAAEGGIVTHC